MTTAKQKAALKVLRKALKNPDAWGAMTIYNGAKVHRLTANDAVRIDITNDGLWVGPVEVNTGLLHAYRVKRIIRAKKQEALDKDNRAVWDTVLTGLLK